MKFKIIDPGLKLQYIPDQDGIDECLNFGKKIGKAIK